MSEGETRNCKPSELPKTKHSWIRKKGGLSGTVTANFSRRDEHYRIFEYSEINCDALPAY
jgi:hypothetical protein